jgi:Tfp pilus assembly protein PilF
MIPKLKRSAGVLFLCLLEVFLLSSLGFAQDKKLSASLSHYIMGVYYEDAGDLERSIQEYQKARDADRYNIDTRLNLATAYLKKNDFAKAIDELNAAVGIDADAPEPHAILALIYSAQGNESLAKKEYETTFKKASARQPKNVEIYKGLGLVYLSQKKYKEAQAAYLLALDLEPDDSEAHFFLGNIYDEQKDRRKAIQEFKRAIKLNPDYHEALNYLGYIYVEENRDLGTADRLIRKAIELDPDNGAYIDSLGWLYFKRSKFKDALNELKKASVLIEDPVVYDHLGDTYYKLKDFDKAKESWDKSLKMDPGQVKVKSKINDLAQIKDAGKKD